MSKFIPIVNPNLPKGRVLHVVISGEYPQFINELNNCGVSVFTTECCPDILPPIRSHADMLFSYLGDGEFLIEKSQLLLKNELNKLGLNSCYDDVSLDIQYPKDVILNSCIIGNKVICGKKCVHSAFESKYEVIGVSQGYAKCSVCVVDSESLITDDISVFNACTSLGMDALLVKKGCVSLNGYDYGFIGGCCGKISCDTVAFCGDLNTHTDADRIRSFLLERNIFALSLSKGPLTDIGSILPITEYSDF